MFDHPLARRILVIGLDGATFNVIEPLVAQGRLPTLARLMREGAHAPLRTTIQPSSEQAWASFMTGVQNGKHGVFSFVRRRPGSYEFEYVSGRDVRAPALWQVLSARGRPTITINVPMTYPPRPVNGVLIGGLMSPGERSRFTYPDGVYEELCQAVGGYIIDVDIERGDLTPEEEERLVEQVHEMIRLRTAATLHLARTRAWDLLTVVYAAPDRVSHKFWKYMDPTHPLCTPEGAARFGQVIPRVYEAVDAAVAELLAALADEQTTVLILSDHGFGPLRQAIYLNKWLAQRGYLAYRPTTPSPGRRAQEAFIKAMRRTLRWIDLPLLSWLKARAFELWPTLKGELFSSMTFAQVDWPRTRAYAVGTMGNVYLNVRGREPAGIIAPGVEYEQVRDQLMAELAALTDDKTAEPVFRAVYRREELYHGPYLEEAPDIVCLKDARYHVAAVDWRTHQDDRVLVPLQPGELLFAADISAQHELDGVLIAWGAGVRPGAPQSLSCLRPAATAAHRGPSAPGWRPVQDDSLRLAGARIVDLAPTILQLLGEPVPVEMDGVPLLGQEDRETRACPEQSEGRQGDLTPFPPLLVTEGGAEGNGGYTEAAAAEVEARLRSLGYLD
jgi:predicted AlkP superfamily phosphohydrolase/phosphomutase